MEANLGEFQRARDIFENLIKRTSGFWKIFHAYADFEFKTCANIEAARDIYRRGIDRCKENERDGERAQLIEVSVTHKIKLISMKTI